MDAKWSNLRWLVVLLEGLHSVPVVKVHGETLRTDPLATFVDEHVSDLHICVVLRCVPQIELLRRLAREGIM